MANNDQSIEDMCAALHAQGIFTTTGRCQCGGYVMTLGGHLYHFASQVLFGSFMSGIVVGLQVRSEQMS